MVMLSGNAQFSGDAWVYDDKPSKEQQKKDRIFINGKWYVEEEQND